MRSVGQYREAVGLDATEYFDAHEDEAKRHCHEELAHRRKPLLRVFGAGFGVGQSTGSFPADFSSASTCPLSIGNGSPDFDNLSMLSTLGFHLKFSFKYPIKLLN